MDTELKNIEKISAYANMVMPAQDREAVWEALAGRIDERSAQKVERKRGNTLGVAAAALAAVVLLAGGLFTFPRVGQNGARVHQRCTVRRKPPAAQLLARP